MTDEDYQAEDDFWMPLSEALEQLSRALQSQSEARQLLISRAQGGELVCKARRAFGRFGGRDLDRSEWCVPRDVWHELDDVSDAQWQRGDLDTRVVRSFGRSQRASGLRPLTLVGVSVARPSLNNVLETTQPTRLPQVVSKVSTETKCKAWLETEFANDPSRQRKKASFLEAALAHFGNELSKRGFIRAWNDVAALHERSNAGRKRSTESNR